MRCAENVHWISLITAFMTALLEAFFAISFMTAMRS